MKKLLILLLLAGLVGGYYVPSSVVNYTHHTTDYANKSINGNVFDMWVEGTTGPIDGVDYDWYIIYNLTGNGAYNITDIQMYTDGENGYGPCSIAVVKLCDEPLCVGESNLLSSSCLVDDNDEDWYDCPITTGGTTIWPVS